MAGIERILRTNSLDLFRLFFNRVSAEVGDLSKLQSNDNVSYFNGDNSTTDFVLNNVVLDDENSVVIVIDGDQKYAETDFDVSDNGTDTTISFTVAPATGSNNIAVFNNIVTILNNFEARILSNDNDITDLYSDLGLDAYNIANTTAHESLADLADSIDVRLTDEIGLADYNTPNSTAHASLGAAVDQVETDLENSIQSTNDDLGLADYSGTKGGAATSLGGKLTNIEASFIADIGLAAYNTPNSTSYTSMGAALDAVEITFENLIDFSSYAGVNGGGATTLGTLITNIDDYYETNLGDIESGSTIRQWWDGIDHTVQVPLVAGSLTAKLNFLDNTKIGDTRVLRDSSDVQWAVSIVDGLQQLYNASAINPDDPIASTYLIKSSGSGDTMVGPLTIARGSVLNPSLIMETDSAGNDDSETTLRLYTNNKTIDWLVGTSGNNFNFVRGHGAGELQFNGNKILNTTDESKYFRTDQSNINDLNFTFQNGRGVSLGSGYKDYAAAETDVTWGGSLSGAAGNNKYIQVPNSLLVKKDSNIILEINDGTVRSKSADGAFSADVLKTGKLITTNIATYYDKVTTTRVGTATPNIIGADYDADGHSFKSYLHSNGPTDARIRFTFTPNASNAQTLSYEWFDAGDQIMNLRKVGTDGRLDLGSIIINGNNNQITATQFNGALSGNASTSTTLATSRNFSIAGATTANAVSFNGSGNVVLNTSLAKPVKVYNEAGTKIFDQNT